LTRAFGTGRCEIGAFFSDVSDENDDVVVDTVMPSSWKLLKNMTNRFIIRSA
jgi:hypothetical protein